MGDLRCDIQELKKFQQRLEKLNESKLDAFCQKCTKELVARLLRKVHKRTPTGDTTYAQTPILRKNKKFSRNQSGIKVNREMSRKSSTVKTKRAVTHTGGTLKRGWTVGTIEIEGNKYTLELTNSVEYAPYVEFGHRQTPGRYVPAIGKRLKKGWADGKFMLTIPMQEMREITPALLEKRLYALLREVFHD